MITISLYVLGYIVLFFIHRWMFLLSQKLDKNSPLASDEGEPDWVNPVGVFMCFIPLLGTLVLLAFAAFAICTTPSFTKFFKYKPKNK